MLQPGEHDHRLLTRALVEGAEVVKRAEREHLAQLVGEQTADHVLRALGLIS